MSDISKKVNIVHHWLIDLYSRSSSCSSARNPEAGKRKRLNTVNFHKGQMIICRAARWRGTKTGFWRVLMNLCTINEMLFSSKGNSHSVTAGKYNNKQLFTQAPGCADFLFFLAWCAETLWKGVRVYVPACVRAHALVWRCFWRLLWNSHKSSCSFSIRRREQLHFEDKTNWNVRRERCAVTHWRAHTHVHIF